MAKSLKNFRPVYVAGIGLHRYQPTGDTSYVELGLTAVRGALLDAAITWEDVETAYVSRGFLPMAAGRPMLRHLGATGLTITHVENASASGSAALRQACLDVAAGLVDVALAVGVDKPQPIASAERSLKLESIAEDAIPPAAHFALLADQYRSRSGATPEELALVAVKNHGNGALNPFAHRQKARTLDEIMQAPLIAGCLTSLQCCPVSEGAAAVIVVSEDAVRRLGMNAARAIRVAGSAARSQPFYADSARYDFHLTRETATLGLEDADISPSQLDVVELHDAFSVEELEYLEAIGICPEGHGVAALKSGELDIGGRCAVSPSGGLLAMGHPMGPTGIGQACEIVRQLRHEAGARQQPAAKTGLAQMVGLGAVAYVHVFERP